MMDNSETPDENEPASVFLNSSQITLQVGERRFVTTEETLTGQSGFFAALLSGRWDNAQADGSYFIDADPDLFEHILRYLRRSVFPLFYDRATGHNHALYAALLAEAKYFLIPRLEGWLERKEYLNVVKINYTADIVDKFDSYSATFATDQQVEFLPTWQTKEKVYICPRGIWMHKGNESACGRQCRNAQGSNEIKYEEVEVLKTVVVRKQTIVNQAALTELESESNTRELFQERKLW